VQGPTKVQVEFAQFTLVVFSIAGGSSGLLQPPGRQPVQQSVYTLKTLLDYWIQSGQSIWIQVRSPTHKHIHVVNGNVHGGGQRARGCFIVTKVELVGVDGQSCGGAELERYDDYKADDVCAQDPSAPLCRGKES